MVRVQSVQVGSIAHEIGVLPGTELLSVKNSTSPPTVWKVRLKPLFSRTHESVGVDGASPGEPIGGF